MTTVPPSLARQARACASASSRSSVTTTPLPAASPSSLTTCGAPRASSASATSSRVVQTRAIAVGTSAAAMTSLAKALLPSSRAASADGPNTAKPGLADRVGDTGHQGRLGPDHHEVDGVPTGERDDARAVEQAAGERFAQGDGVHPGVAGGHDHRIHVRVGAKGLDDGVLAGTGTDDENLHGPSVESRPTGHECAASRGGRGDILPGTPRSRRAVAWRGNLQPCTWVDAVD